MREARFENKENAFSFLSFNNFVLFAIILIYFSNIFFSYSLSMLESNRRSEMVGLKTTLEHIDKQAKEATEEIRKMEGTFTELTNLAEQQKVEIARVEEITKSFKSSKDVERREAVREVCGRKDDFPVV